MRTLLLVGSGGFIGSASRFYLGGLILRLSGEPRFPLPHLIINVLGCLLIGVIAGIGPRFTISEETRLFLQVGLLGGFTTFSAFGLETFLLIQKQQWGVAAGNILLSVSLSILGVWIGMRLATV